MNGILLTILSFLVAISILITVHEFGHYWVARRLGVKVLRFSIGFGKPLWRYVGRDTDRVEYVISALPLGGYVKMLDEREGEVAPEELPRAFNRQPIAKRFAIVAAGPVFNLLFAVFAYWVMFMHGIPGLKPVLGPVPEGTVAATAKLHQGDLILAVNGSQVGAWGDVLELVLPKALLRDSVELLVESEGVKSTHTLHLEQLTGKEDQNRLPEIIGLLPYRPLVRPVIDEVLPGKVAERAGIHQGDLITEVSGRATPEWKDVVEAISSHPGEPITVTVDRAGQLQTLTMTPDSVEVKGKVIGQIGIAPVIPDLPDSMVVNISYGPVDGLTHAFYRTWENSVVTLQLLGEMLVGRISPDNLSGPITIATYAKASAMQGFAEFLHFLAVVSLSLGVLNLLPIPVLDGGHLAFYLVELVKGSPVSERTEMVAQRIGLALILALMTLALYNDLARSAG